MYKNEPQELREWIDDEILPEHLRAVKGKENIFTQPYSVIEEKLNKLTDGKWSEQNFRYSLHSVEGEAVIAASIELVLPVATFGAVHGSYTRTLVGTVTRKLSELKGLGESEEDGGNEHYTATVKSLCKVNAVKPLGRSFGKYLNKVELPFVESAEDFKFLGNAKPMSDVDVAEIKNCIIHCNSQSEANKLLIKWHKAHDSKIGDLQADEIQDFINAFFKTK